MSSLPLLTLTLALSSSFTLHPSSLPAQDPLPGTKPLTTQGDLAAQMVAGIRKFYLAETERVAAARETKWHREYSSPEAYSRWVDVNREHLADMIGSELARRRTTTARTLNPVSFPTTDKPFEDRLDFWIVSEFYRPVPSKMKMDVKQVRWPVLDGVNGEGLLLTPKSGKPVADVILLPDCGDSPEYAAGLSARTQTEQALGYRLVLRGCRVLIPVLIDRRDEWSGHPNARYTNQPHREFLWRAAYEVGRTPIGYEVDKVLAAAVGFNEHPLGIIGCGEGGLIAMYASALDSRFKSTVVSGYFGPRENLWSEPIYRNVFGLLTEFGDAEVASLIAPRALLIDACDQPLVTGPPAPRANRSGAAPGAINTPKLAEVRKEFQRAVQFSARLQPAPVLEFITPDDGRECDDKTLDRFTSILSPDARHTVKRPSPGGYAGVEGGDAGEKLRLHRQFTQLVEHTQRLMRESQYRRAEFWSKADATSPEKWAETTKQYRDLFWGNVIGRLPAATMPMNAHTRLVYDEPKYRGYEVMLDVYDDVYAYGILLVPKDLKPGEKRPVVVCQHGLEGRPQDVADPKVDSPYYHRFACKLAEQGFITYAPQNPYIGGDNFRVLLRMAQPLGKTLFSVIARQHERTLDWLETLPFVDPKRMAFYGLSYGGKTAMRMPAILDRYCLSICSADYNEWIWKCTDARSPYSYLFTNEYDMPEWNLANSFNYAEMSWLICPRPFMVERGHMDTVAPDEWVAYEYAKTRRRYDLLGLGDRTELDVFNGPHTIHAVGTFAFLKKHLHWPEN